jgi:hypothetical protein
VILTTKATILWVKNRYFWLITGKQKDDMTVPMLGTVYGTLEELKNCKILEKIMSFYYFYY